MNSAAAYALVITPTPTHPADHGNRQRVAQMTRFLRRSGFAVDVVLYPMDADLADAVPSALDAMAAAWGGLCCVVPPSRALHQPPSGLDHTLDEWWDPALDAQLAWLCRRRAYAVMWVNYTFLSRAFLHAPPGCLKVLDTHDALAGRRARFAQAGLAAEFFHTDAATEAAALARAELVVAIKPAEAEHFRRLGARAVVTVPVALTRAKPAKRQDRAADAPLRAGFIGADNQVNARGLLAFLARWAVWQAAWLPDVELVVAGGVCRHLPPGAAGVVALGRVEDAAAFYDTIDVVLAPTLVSTGLKVKLAEALAWNMPFLATADACDGFTPADPFHALDGPDALCAALLTLAAEPDRLAALAAATPRVAARLERAVAAGLAAIEVAFAHRRRRIAVVTDIPVADRRTLEQERGWQAVAYLAALRPVVLFQLAGEPDIGRPEADGLPPNVQHRACADVAALEAALAGAGPLAACLVSLAGSASVRLPAGLATLRDDWPAQVRGRRRPTTRELRLDDGTRLSVTPLRHLPPCLSWHEPLATRHLLIVLVERAVPPPAPAHGRPHEQHGDLAGAPPWEDCATAPLWDDSATVFPWDDSAIVAGLLRVSPVRVAVVPTTSIACDPALLGTLAALPAPTMVATVGAGPLSRELAGALADWAGAACTHLSPATYPVLLGGRLVGDVATHLDTISDWLTHGSPPAGAERAPDAGWSVLWRRLERETFWLPAAA